MITIVDAGPLISAASATGPESDRIREALTRAPGRLVVPAPVTAEVDYLLTKQAGAGAARAFLQDVAAGRFDVECLEPGEYRSVLELSMRYAGLAPGLADLSIVVLAQRFGTHRIMTIDQRHFRAMVALDGEAFVLVPWDGV